MRICILTPTFLPRIGGAELCIDQLARNFTRDGHEVLVVAQQATGPGQALQGPYPVVYYRRPLSQNGFYLRLKRLLDRLQHKHHFDILNAHLAYPGGYVGLWFARQFHLPLVVTPHGGGVFYRSRFRSRRRIWKRIQRSLNQADAVIALSSYLEKLIAEIAPRQKNIVRIGNGVNNVEFAQCSPELPEPCRSHCGNQYILALGRLVPRKGFDTILASFAAVHHRFSRLRLVFAGDGPERTRLEQQAKQFDVAEKTIFLGTVLGPEKIDLLHHCLFTVVPSVEEDNMPLVLLESMACGKPVLASRLGGMPDIVIPGENGQLCRPGDVSEFAHAMTHMMEVNAAQTMADAARNTAQRLDWTLIADQYLELFDQLRQT